MVTVEVLQEALSAAQQECEVALSQFLATEVAFELKEWAQRQADELLSALYSFAEPSQVRAIVVGVYGHPTASSWGARTCSKSPSLRPNRMPLTSGR